MAQHHVRAVQDRCTTTDPIARNVLQVIALDMGLDDSPAFTSLRKIAKRAGCHYNTVSKKIDLLCDKGDLIVTKDGKYNQYSLPYDCDNYRGDYHSKGVTKEEGLSHPMYVTKEELAQELSQLEERLSHRLSQQIEKLSHKLAQIVTPHGDVTEVRSKEESKDNPPTPRQIDHEPTLPGMPSDLTPPVDVDWPKSLNRSGFIELWWQYEHHRDELGKPLSTITRQKQVDKAERVGVEAASWVINQTLENGWQGLIWERLSERSTPNGQGATDEELELSEDGTW